MPRRTGLHHSATLLCGGLFVTCCALAQVQPTPPAGQAQDPRAGQRLETPPLTTPLRPLGFAVLPRRSTPLLARLPFCGTAPAQNAPACAMVQQDNGPVDGSIPPTEVTVETTGGAHPISLSLTVQPPSLADRFEIALPSTHPQLVHNDPQAAFEEAQRRGHPAANLKRIIRFNGLPAGAPVPTSIVVMIIARDHKGEVKGTDFRIYPYSPRITAATGHENHSALESVSMRLQLDGVGLAGTARPFRSIGTGCTWFEVGDGISLGSFSTTNVNFLRHEEITLAERPVVIRRSGAFTREGPCDFRLDAMFTFPFMAEGERTPIVSMRSPQPLTFAARQQYRVTNTWQLAEKWNWFGSGGVTTKMGQCTGTSDFGAGKFTVGRQQSNSDLSFRIRSGPVGTDCIYSNLSSVSLPDGFKLDSADWDVSATEKCRVVDEDGSDGALPISYTFAEQPWTFAPGLADFRGFSGPLVSGRTTLIDSANPTNRLRVILRPTLVHLKCDMTAINDHQVRITLNEVTFSGPPGESFP